MRRFLILALLSTAALIAFAAIPAARPHSLLAGLSGSAQATDKNSADGAAKDQATEGTAVPTKGGKPSKSKKLPGKMKSGT